MNENCCSDENYNTDENVCEYELKPTSDTGAPSRQKGSNNWVPRTDKELDEFGEYLSRSFLQSVSLKTSPPMRAV